MIYNVRTSTLDAGTPIQGMKKERRNKVRQNEEVKNQQHKVIDFNNYNCI